MIIDDPLEMIPFIDDSPPFSSWGGQEWLPGRTMRARGRLCRGRLSAGLLGRNLWRNLEISWLVGGLEHFLFSTMYGIILPIDFHIFLEGVGIPPTRWNIGRNIGRHHYFASQVGDFCLTRAKSTDENHMFWCLEAMNEVPSRDSQLVVGHNKHRDWVDWWPNLPNDRQKKNAYPINIGRLARFWSHATMMNPFLQFGRPWSHFL